MDAVGLDCPRDVDQILIDHGDKCRVALDGEVAEDLVECFDIVWAVIRGQSDAGEQDLDAGILKRGYHLVEVAAALVKRKAAEAVVAAELNDDYFGAKGQDGMESGNGVFGRGTAGTLIADLVVVGEVIEITLECVGERLTGLKPVACSDAVAEADQNGPVGGQHRAGRKQNQERNDKFAANVHRDSVRE